MCPSLHQGNTIVKTLLLRLLKIFLFLIKNHHLLKNFFLNFHYWHTTFGFFRAIFYKATYLFQINLSIIPTQTQSYNPFTRELEWEDTLGFGCWLASKAEFLGAPKFWIYDVARCTQVTPRGRHHNHPRAGGGTARALSPRSLPKVTQLQDSKARLWTQFFLTSKLNTSTGVLPRLLARWPPTMVGGSNHPGRSRREHTLLWGRLVVAVVS